MAAAAAAAIMELNEIAIQFCDTPNSHHITIIDNNPNISSCDAAAAAAGTSSGESRMDNSNCDAASSNKGYTEDLNEIIVADDDDDDDDDSTNYVEITLDVLGDSVTVLPIRKFSGGDSEALLLDHHRVTKETRYQDTGHSSDYNYWKIELEIREEAKIEVYKHLESQDLSGIIDGSEPRPYKCACFGYNYHAWKVKDKRAREAMKSMVGQRVLMNCGMLESDSAKEVWDKLLAADSLFKERYLKMVEAATTARENLDEVREANDDFLTPSNYHSYKLYLKQLLISQYLWGIVDGSDYRTSDNYRRWEEMNKAALSIIQSSCGPAMLVHTQGTRFAQEAWSSIARAVGDFAEVKDSYAKYLPLIELIIKDDHRGFWRYYGHFNQEARADRLKEDGSTVLHVAVELRRLKIVKQILLGMNMKQSEMKTDKGNAAISLAVEGNNMEMVKLMVEKNPNFLLIQNEHGHIPLLASAINGDEEMLRYLYKETPMEQIIVDEYSTKDGASASLSNKDGATLITAAIRVDIYDVALDLLKRFPRLATTQDENGKTVFSVLAGKPSAFPSGNQFGFFQRCIYGNAGANSDGLAGKVLKAVVPFMKQLHDKREKHDQALQIINFICPRLSGLNSDLLKQAQAFEAIYQTTIHGIIEFFTLLTNSNHNLIHFKDEDENGLFQHAVLSRQEKIFGFIIEMGLQNQSTTIYDKHKNNILHCAGFWKPSSQLDKVSGAALQMQREIQWFQEVERVVKLKYREMKNNKNKKPAALFTQQHRTLVKEGEKWIKEASQACMVVSTLIATVMFAAAFTVPGGNDQNTGLPILIDSATFMVFVVSDAVSLFASCTSILMFFTLLTARYAERDFQTSLPRKLILGLFFLFVSIAFMMATFAATLVTVLQKKIPWAYAPVILLATIPVFLFGSLQFPLFYDIVMSTYGRGIFRRKESSFCSNTMMRLSTWCVNSKIYTFFFRTEATFTTLQRDWSFN